LSNIKPIKKSTAKPRSKKRGLPNVTLPEKRQIKKKLVTMILETRNRGVMGKENGKMMEFSSMRSL
jgi:hypothetical protein